MHEGPRNDSKKFEEAAENPEPGPTLAIDTSPQSVVPQARGESVTPHAAQEDAALTAVKQRLGMEVPAENETAAQEIPEAEGVTTAASQESATNERERQLRSGAGELARAVEFFGSELGQRDKNGMDPFIDRRAFSVIRAGFQELRAATEATSEISSENLALSISVLTRGLKQFGNVRRSGALREDPRSLGRLSVSVEDIGKAGSQMRSTLGEGDEALLGALTALHATTATVSDGIMRLRNAASKYLR